LEILPVDGIPIKPVRDKVRMTGYQKILPEEDPEIRGRFIQSENVFSTASFKNYGDPVPKSSYRDFYIHPN
jgi:hypothetical protein